MRFKKLVLFFSSGIDESATMLAFVAGLKGHSRDEIRRAMIIAFRTTADVLEKYPNEPVTMERIQQLSEEAYAFHEADTKER